MPSKKTLIWIIAIVVILGGALYFFSRSGGSEVVAINLEETDWTRGATNPKVTLIEYGDFQCPACAVYEDVVQKIQADFKDTLVFSYRHFPLTQIHQNALLSAKSAEASGRQQKFWEMHDLLYKNQKEWETSPVAKDTFIRYAKELGLDIVKFEKDLSDSAISKKIEDDYKGGVKLKVLGTPTFFLNGKKIDNPGSYDDFKKKIEEVLNQSSK